MQVSPQRAEAYRALCSLILLSSPNNPARVLVMSSAVSGEGKSTVSCNLAVALAQHGRRVLLVDADMRRPANTQREYDAHSEITVRPGLSTMFADSGHSSHSSLYQPLADLPNLNVLPAGPVPPHPSEVLASHQMQELVETWS